MGEWLAIGGATVVLLTIAHHLGLIGAVVGVVKRIASCPLCTAFWGAVLVLMLRGCYILTALAVALPLAYFSVWLGIVLDALRQYYDTIWQTITTNRHHTNRSRGSGALNANDDECNR